MKTIHIIGLGASGEDSLTLGAINILKKSKKIYLRTKMHPAVSFLEREKISYESFDCFYEAAECFEEVYEKIANFLLDYPVDEIAYCVPGAPMFFEDSVSKLIALKPETIDIKIYGAVSFMENVFSALSIDAASSFKMLDGLNLDVQMPDAASTNIICQVYSRQVASEVKLKLMEVYSPEASVILINDAGGKQQSIRKGKLYEIDRFDDISYLTTLVIPPQEPEQSLGSFSTLLEVISKLRGENGCPWDRAQTHKSLGKYMIEEAYEALDAMNENDTENLMEELGDVLLQVVLHSQIAREAGEFTITDVISGINEKMIRRHPKVFSTDEKERNKSWEEIKMEEKNISSIEESIESIAPSLPPLMKAKKYAKILGEKEPMPSKDDFNFVAENKNALNDEVVGKALYHIVKIAVSSHIDPSEALNNYLKNLR